MGFDPFGVEQFNNNFSSVKFEFFGFLSSLLTYIFLPIPYILILIQHYSESRLSVSLETPR